MSLLADKKIECFTVAPDEDVLYYGTISGQIVTLELNSFHKLQEIQAHVGTIIAMTVHKSLPYLACLGMDRLISVWSISEKIPRQLSIVSIRNITAENDIVNYLDVKSNAQAISFHPIERIIAARSANGAIAEIKFNNEGDFTLIRCTRFHAEFDVITVRYTAEPPYYLLSGSGNGEAVVSLDGSELRRWKIEDESIHWFEHIHSTQYLIASDSRLLSRIDILKDNVLCLGPKFAADDFEHVVINKKNGRVFASSFDRNVYELDPINCEPLGVIFKAPFKCRWLYSFSKNPKHLIVQVRNGSLFLVDVDNQRIVKSLRTTALALWTGVFSNWRTITVFGEGSKVLQIERNNPDAATTIPNFSVKNFTLECLPETGYIKRADHDMNSNLTVFGHSSGLLIFCKKGIVFKLPLEKAIRDLKISKSRFVFTATEGGSVFKIDTHKSYKQVASYQSPQNYPIWAIAILENGEKLAVFERHGKIAILQATDLRCLSIIPDGGRCKRAKCLSNSTIMYTRAGELHVLDVDACTTSLRVPHAGNTIEDFIWDKGQNYIVCIGYTNTVGLYDFRTGDKLDEVYDQIDYSKGIMWAQTSKDNTVYPLDFITYGRSGTACLYRIHNESIVNLGQINTNIYA